jgi:hypothetical protein
VTLLRCSGIVEAVGSEEGRVVSLGCKDFGVEAFVQGHVLEVTEKVEVY